MKSLHSPLRLVALLSTCLLTYVTPAKANIIVDSVKSVSDGGSFSAYLYGSGNATPIRVRGVDTPKINGHCSYESNAAIKARNFTRAKLASAREIRLTEIGSEQYALVLAKVSIDGQLLSDLLIARGLGRKSQGWPVNWCN